MCTRERLEEYFKSCVFGGKDFGKKNETFRASIFAGTLDFMSKVVRKSVDVEIL
jgi:hypothetical protein